MQNAISIFNFNQSQVRIQFHNGEPFFCLKDVAAILEIQNTKQSRFNLNEKGVHKMYHQTAGGNQEITFINEPNLYRVIFRSNKPEAVKFQDWIFEEVIPQIRATGSYQNSGSLQTQTTLPDCLTLEQQDQIKKLHRQLVQAAPKEQQAKLAITLWSSIKSKFGVSYKKVPSEHYPEVLSLMARVAVERMETLHGEVLDKTQAPPFNQTEFACHFVKLLNYARCYLRFQKLLCSDPNSPKAQDLLNYFQYSVNVNQTGFLFVFKPDVENDIQKAVDFIHHHFQQYDLQMI